MRKAGHLLRGMLILAVTAVTASTATPAFADSPQWERACGPKPFTQQLELRGLSFRTDNPYQLEPSAFHADGTICGAWAMRVPEDEDPRLNTSVWVWTLRYDDDGDPRTTEDQAYGVTIGEYFDMRGHYATPTRIENLFQCERVGESSESLCGGAGRPNVFFNGYADDAKCSSWLGTIYAVVYFRDGGYADNIACMPWRERP